MIGLDICHSIDDLIFCSYYFFDQYCSHIPNATWDCFVVIGFYDFTQNLIMSFVDLVDELFQLAYTYNGALIERKPFSTLLYLLDSKWDVISPWYFGILCLDVINLFSLTSLSCNVFVGWLLDFPCTVLFYFLTFLKFLKNFELLRSADN